MKVLVIGKGGREHAVVKKLARDGVEEIYCAPGNAGIAREAKLVDIPDDDVTALADFAARAGIDLTIVGPESALVAGVVDEFESRGLRIFGPTKAAAELEGSKAFAKQLMAAAGIPTAAYAEFTELDAALDFLQSQPMPIVIKADGLAAGKGVVIAQSLAEAEQAVTEMLEGNKFGAAGHRVVIEEFLDGEEFSLLCFVGGGNYLPMPIARDYKRAFDGDGGPNTGGMGAHSPNPLITDADRAEALRTIAEPTIAALAGMGRPFTGVLYAGLIKTAAGVKVIEFNVRFGDPETEVVLPLLETPLVEVVDGLLDAAELANQRAGVDSGTQHRGQPKHHTGGFDPSRASGQGKLDHPLSWSDDATVGVVLASRGYPGDYPKGAVISGLDALNDVDVYHMGTATKDEQIVTNGGRVLFIVGRGATLSEARDRAYKAVDQVECPELFHRTDIAAAVT